MITFLDWVGRITTLIFLVTLVLGTTAWLRGILPALWRLGNGFSKRKIAIFAKGDTLISLKSLLSDTKMFNEKNIIDISSDNDIGRAERATLFLVAWDDWQQNKIDEILSAKKDTTALVVYAPKGPRSIPGR